MQSILGQQASVNSVCMLAWLNKQRQHLNTGLPAMPQAIEVSRSLTHKEQLLKKAYETAVTDEAREAVVRAPAMLHNHLAVRQSQLSI